MRKDETQTLFDISEAERYDLDHPDIWIEFEKKALELAGKGIGHYGAKAIFEVIRFHRTIERVEGEDFKCNNNFTAYYARKFIEKYPEHEGFFELRERKASQ